MLCLSILSSCSKEQNYSKLILGKWEWTRWEHIKDGEIIDSGSMGQYLYTFNDDGSVEFYEPTESMKVMGQYSITGNKLFIAGYAVTIQKMTSDELVLDTSQFATSDYDIERNYYKKVK